MSLNVLIDMGKAPKENTEYILVADVIHQTPTWEDKTIRIPAGTIVVDVTIKKDQHFDFLGYDFKVKETGFMSHTNYPWILAENSRTNQDILNGIKAHEEAIQHSKDNLEKWKKNLKTLAI